MIVILNYKDVNKNTLECTVNVKVPKWGNFVINEIAVFRKNNQRWIAFPSRQYEKDGEKKYYTLNKFEDPMIMKAFQDELIKELDKYKISKNTKVIEPSQLDFMF